MGEVLQVPYLQSRFSQQNQPEILSGERKAFLPPECLCVKFAGCLSHNFVKVPLILHLGYPNQGEEFVNLSHRLQDRHLVGSEKLSHRGGCCSIQVGVDLHLLKERGNILAKVTSPLQQLHLIRSSFIFQQPEIKPHQRSHFLRAFVGREVLQDVLVDTVPVATQDLPQLDGVGLVNFTGSPCQHYKAIFIFQASPQ